MESKCFGSEPSVVSEHLNPGVSAYLKLVAQTLKESDPAVAEPGIRGGTGMALFLFLYARVAQDSECEDLAGAMLELMTDRIGPDVPCLFSSGVSGLASGMLYLRSRGFIEWENSELFPYLDQYLGALVPYFTSANWSLPTGILGPGKYFSLRMHYANGEDMPAVEDARRAILASLGKPYLSVVRLLDLLDYLCDQFTLGVPEPMVEQLLVMYLQQLRLQVFGCMRYRAYEDQFSLMGVASVCFRVWETTGNKEALCVAEDMLRLRFRNRSTPALYSCGNDPVFERFLSGRPDIPNQWGEWIEPNGSAFEALSGEHELRDSPELLAIRGLRMLYVTGAAGNELLELLPLSYWNYAIR